MMRKERKGNCNVRTSSSLLTVENIANGLLLLQCTVRGDVCKKNESERSESVRLKRVDTEQTRRRQGVVKEQTKSRHRVDTEQSKTRLRVDTEQRNTVSGCRTDEWKRSVRYHSQTHPSSPITTDPYTTHSSPPIYLSNTFTTVAVTTCHILQMIWNSNNPDNFFSYRQINS